MNIDDIREKIAEMLAIQTLEDESLAGCYVWQWVIDNGFVQEYYDKADQILSIKLPERECPDCEGKGEIKSMHGDGTNVWHAVCNGTGKLKGITVEQAIEGGVINEM